MSKLTIGYFSKIILFSPDRLILLDNCSIYKSKKPKDAIIKYNLKELYQSASSHDFAPIEMRFSILKQNIVKE